MIWKTVWRFLRNLKTDIPLLKCYREKVIPVFGGVILISMLTADLFTIAKTWNEPRCSSTDDQIKELWHTHTVEYYSVGEVEQFI